jgi:hypothetical protein
MNGSMVSGTGRDTAIVLRQRAWIAAELLLGGALVTAFFLIPAHHHTLHSLAGGASIGSVVAIVLLARYRCEVRDGQVTARELWYPARKADLTRLTAVTAAGKRESFVWSALLGQRRYLTLRDERGCEVRLSFSGTSRAQRRRLLAALEPYVMADGVSRDGLVREALDGQLWWPRPRPQSS